MLYFVFDDFISMALFDREPADLISIVLQMIARITVEQRKRIKIS